MRAELIAYQRKQLCLKIAYEPALLDSLEATHAKLVELKNYHNLQNTHRRYQTTSIAHHRNSMGPYMRHNLIVFSTQH